MLTINPFSVLSGVMPSVAMQVFVILMIILVIAGTVLDMIHKKNVKYFFENAKKAKESATRSLNSSEKTSIVFNYFFSHFHILSPHAEYTNGTFFES